MSGTLPRGQAIRRRADIQRTEIIAEPTTILRRLFRVGSEWTMWSLRWGAWAVLMTAWGLVYVPAAGALTLLLVAAALLGGSWTLSATAAAAGIGVWAWSRYSPATWSRWVLSRGHRFWRRIRYRFVWDDVMAACGIKATDAAHRVLVPRLLWVRLGHHTDRLTVQLCPGVTVERLAQQVDALASEWAALEVRVTRHPR